ncbi:hypothetical protein ACYU03_13635 [Pseudomonas sp. X10]
MLKEISHEERDDTMSNMHDQAMQFIYQQVLQRLLEHMSQAQRASLQLLIQRLVVAAGGLEYIDNFRLLVLDGGDRRSAHGLACLRAAQLSIASRAQGTFALRVAVARQAEAGQSLLTHCERRYGALFLHDDPRVELLMIEDGQVLPFDARRPLPDSLQAQEREALLLLGHLARGRPIDLLGSRRHLALADAYGKVLQWHNGVDALITVMSPLQRQRFLAWARRCLRVAGQPAGWPLQQCARSLIDGLGKVHQQLIHHLRGIEPDEGCARHCKPVERPLRVIAIDDLLQDMTGQGRLDKMLGDTAPWPCAPALSPPLDSLLPAHLHGLHAQFVLQRGYHQGLGAFAGPAQQLGARQAAEALRADAEAQLYQAFGVNDTHLGCLLFSPFIGRGEQLELFLRRCHPAMRVALPYLHKALQGRACPESVEQWLVKVSGLPLPRLQMLYRRRPWRKTGDSLLAVLARRDIDLRYARQATFATKFEAEPMVPC